MFTYADPLACPGCRAPLGQPPRACEACGLGLVGPMPRQVFAALKGVDHLVSQMYASAHSGPASAPSPEQTPAYQPIDFETSTPGAGLSAASVPKILLGLGALCLLVASLVFLAVSWAALGVGGRTAVLVLFTVVAAGLTLWTARRELRAGAEAFAAVALGLLALDLSGAWNAGWLGSLDERSLLLVIGSVVTIAAMAVGMWSATSRVGLLVSAQVAGVLGVVAASVSLHLRIDQGVEVGSLAGITLCAATAAAGHRLGQRVLAAGCAVVAGAWWLALVAAGAARFDTLSVAHLWLDLAAWPVLVAAAMAAAMAAVRRLPFEARVMAASVAVALLTLCVTAPSFDESPTRVALVELTVIVVSAGLVAALVSGWRWVVAAPALAAATGLGGSTLVLAVRAVDTVVPPEAWALGVSERVGAPDMVWSWPLLLPAGVLGVALTVAIVRRCAGREPRVVAWPAAGATVVAAALIAPLYDAPLAVVVLLLLLGTLVLGGAAAFVHRRDLGVLAAGLAALTLAAALANDWTTAGVLLVFTTVAVVAELRGDEELRLAGIIAAPPLAAGLTWTVAALAGVEMSWRALPVVLLLGVAIVARPRLEREISAAVVAAVVVSVSVQVDGRVDESWLAVYLTVSGAMAMTSALVHRDRRHLAWVGLGLLTLAQWVRLNQLGVETVEAYTLPLALVLLGAGVVALRRTSESTLRLLGPGLALALVPTLFVVLGDPVSLRALLLGTACLVLVVVGAVQRWAAPLVAGAMTGTVVVLREASHAQVLDQWAVIGLIGILLTVLGITWEQRVRDARRVSAYVRSLR